MFNNEINHPQNMQRLAFILLNIVSIIGISAQGNPPSCEAGATELINDQGSYYCAWCPAGMHGYQYDGYNLCENCEAGYYQPSQGQTSCSECPAAYYSNAGSTTCSGCPAGYVTPNPGSASCTECPAGTFQGTPQLGCDDCTYGTYSLPGTSGAENCISCPVNTYCPMFGCPSCLPCPFASYTTSTQNIACTNCSVDNSAVSGCEGGAIVAVNITNQANNPLTVSPLWSPQIETYSVFVSGSTSAKLTLILQAPPGTTVSNRYVFQWSLTCSPSCGTFSGTQYLFNTNDFTLTLTTLTIPAFPGPFFISLNLLSTYYGFNFIY